VHCWIGLNDIAVENVFEWIDGTSVSYTNWNTNEPNNRGGEHIVHMLHESGYWNDDHESQNFGYPLCKYPKTQPTFSPTGIPTLSPTKFCDVARCYGNGAFGANCSGPPDEINFPVTLANSTTSYQAESEIPIGHVEIYPEFAIDFTSSIIIRFETQITNIPDGANYGAVFAVSVKYDGCYSQVFSLTQPMWAATSCADEQWHSWEVNIRFDGIEVYCDDNVVWNHARTDMQVSWEVGDEAPFLVIGAYYSPIYNSWQSRCNMVVWNVEILTCDTGTPSSTPSKSPTVLPTGTPTHFPTSPPTRVPTARPTSYPTEWPTGIPTYLPTRVPSKTPTDIPTSIPSETPTNVPTTSPTASCDVLTVQCYGQNAFGAECKGPTDPGFPITLTKATTPGQAEDKGVCGSHIEVFPTKSIDLAGGVRIQFDSKIFDISAGAHYGSLFTLSVKYDGPNKELFLFKQAQLASTPCNDAKWHSWETVVYSGTVRVYCDEALVHTHARSDSQLTWNVGDDSPFFVVGAHFWGGGYTSRCDMILKDLRVFTCEKELDA